MLKNRLKEIRMKEYMASSKEFATALGVARTTYSQWELSLSYPKLEKAYEIAKILNKDINDIWYMD